MLRDVANTSRYLFRRVSLRRISTPDQPVPMVTPTVKEGLPRPSASDVTSSLRATSYRRLGTISQLLSLNSELVLDKIER